MKTFFSDFKDLLSSVGLNFLIKLLGLFLAYLNLVIITNYYGLDIFGAFSICIVILNIGQVISKFGLDTSILRLLGEFNKLKKPEISTIILKSFLIVLCFGFFINLAIYLSSNILADFLNKPWLANDIKIISYLVIPFSFISLLSAIFQALDFTKEQMFVKTVVVQLLFLSFLIIDIIFAFQKSVIVLYLFSTIIGFLFVLFFFLRRIRQIKLYLDNFYTNQKEVSFKKITKISFPMLMSTSVFLIMGWTDILMLGYYKGESEVGVFNTCLKVATLTGICLVAVNSIVVQKFTFLFLEKKFRELKKIVKKSTKLIFFMSFPILIIFLFFPSFILNFFNLGEGDDVLILRVLVIGQFINAACGSVGLLMLMTNQEKLQQKIIISATIFNALLNLFLIPKFGVLGAAWTNTICLAYWNVFMVFSVKKNLNFWTVYIPFIKT